MKPASEREIRIELERIQVERADLQRKCKELEAELARQSEQLADSRRDLQQEREELVRLRRELADAQEEIRTLERRALRDFQSQRSFVRPEPIARGLTFHLGRW